MPKHGRANEASTPPPRPAASVKATDPVDEGKALVEIFPPHSYRWAIYDRPSRTIFFGGPDIKIHMTVAELSGLLCRDSHYYSPGPNAQLFGGFICRSADGKFWYDPFSGTFPGWDKHVPEAAAALREVCEREGVPWREYDAKRREFD